MVVVEIMRRWSPQKDGCVFVSVDMPPPLTFVEDDVERLLEVLHVRPQPVQVDCRVMVVGSDG